MASPSRQEDFQKLCKLFFHIEWLRLQKEDQTKYLCCSYVCMKVKQP